MVKRYRVTGGSVVAGHQPGDEFEHDYLEHEERALLAGGAIRVVGLGKRAERKTEAKPERKDA